MRGRGGRLRRDIPDPDGAEAELPRSRLAGGHRALPVKRDGDHCRLSCRQGGGSRPAGGQVRKSGSVHPQIRSPPPRPGGGPRVRRPSGWRETGGRAGSSARGRMRCPRGGSRVRPGRRRPGSDCPARPAGRASSGTGRPADGPGFLFRRSKSSTSDSSLPTARLRPSGVKARDRAWPRTARARRSPGSPSVGQSETTPVRSAVASVRLSGLNAIAAIGERTAPGPGARYDGPAPGSQWDTGIQGATTAIASTSQIALRPNGQSRIRPVRVRPDSTWAGSSSGRMPIRIASHRSTPPFSARPGTPGARRDRSAVLLDGAVRGRGIARSRRGNPRPTE